MPGGDLLFRCLSSSTIGAAGFHGRVRDGIGWDTGAMATRQWGPRMSPAKWYFAGTPTAEPLGLPTKYYFVGFPGRHASRVLAGRVGCGDEIDACTGWTGIQRCC